jgi:AmpE protein
MALTIILIALAVQRYLHVASVTYHFNWIEPYYQWMIKRVQAITTGHGLMGVAILVLPILLGVAIFFSIFYHLLTVAIYYVLSLAFFWYCVDGRDLFKATEGKMGAQEIFLHSYQHLFALIFWFFIFGPVGLALYYSVAQLRHYLTGKADENEKELLKYAQLVQGVLDWVPLRLLGLCFALVGHFVTVFKSWIKQLFGGIQTDQQQAVGWGMIALKHGTDSEQKGSANQAQQAQFLVDRALLVWLVLIALFTIGYWVG